MNLASALGSAGLVAIFAAACGITVIVPGQTGDSTGAGAGATGGGAGPGGPGGNSTGSGDVKPPSDCSTTCSTPPSGETCDCTVGCGSPVVGAFEKISCAPVTDLQGNHKVECVCSVQDFSGVCFELDLAHLCDFENGCCAKYFSGK